MKFVRIMLVLSLNSLASVAIAQTGTDPVYEPKEESVSSVFLRAELFGAYRLTMADNDDFNEFEVDRAEFGAGYDEPNMGGMLLNLEVVRSASGESLLGIDTNSQVARLKHAYAYADPQLGPGEVIAHLGLVQDLWIATLEDGYDIRAARPLMSERSGFFDTSDLGLTLGYELWDGVITVAWQLTNGEGRNQTEQNTGKNSTVVLSARLLEVWLAGEQATIGIHGLYRDGSLGVAVARNHRYGAGLTMSHPRFSVGSEWVLADGTNDRSNVDANVLGFWATGRILDPWLGIHAGFDRQVMDQDVDDSALSVFSAGVFTDLVGWTARVGQRDLAEYRGNPLERLRLYLTYERWSYGVAAGPVLGVAEASDLNRIMLTVETRGLANIRLP